MKKETYYFSHDFGARNDPKLQEVLMEHGVGGLGIFWCVIELLYEQCGKVPLRQIKAIAFGLHVEAKDVESVIKDFGLFKVDDEYFWSESVLARLKKRDDANESRRQKRLAFFRRQKENQLQDNLKSTSRPLEDDSNKGKEIKEKENKRKESKEKDTSTDVDDKDIDIKEKIVKEESVTVQAQPPKVSRPRVFKPPTMDDVREYIAERKSCVNPETFWNFYETKGWMVGKNKMKDWKACVRTWENNGRQLGRTELTQINGVSRAGYGRIGPERQK